MLPPDFEALALEHGLIKTQWPNAKVSTAAELLRFILLHVGDGWYVANDNLSPLAVVEQLYYDWQFTQTYEK